MRTTITRSPLGFVATCHNPGEPPVQIVRPTREQAITAARQQAKLRHARTHEIEDRTGAPVTEPFLTLREAPIR